MTVTVIIPSIPPRRDVLQRAVRSVLAQTHPATAIRVEVDTEHTGAGATRNRALRGISTEWVAFVDDDDELLPDHLEVLLGHAAETGADVVWPWFEPVGMADPIAANRGRQWDPQDPHTFPITALVRATFASQVEFPPPERPEFSGEDWHYWVGLSERGAKFSHVERVTWLWHYHGRNTSGAPGRW